MEVMRQGNMLSKAGRKVTLALLVLASSAGSSANTLYSMLSAVGLDYAAFKLAAPDGGLPIDYLEAGVLRAVVTDNAFLSGMECGEGLEQTPPYKSIREHLAALEGWRKTMDRDRDAGVTHWDPNGSGPSSSKAKGWYKAIMENPWRNNETFDLIARCAKKRGLGSGYVTMNVTEKWVTKRINEYEEYLPKVWCDKRVHSWMQNNYELASEILPMVQADKAEHITYWFEWLPLTNSKFLLHKELSDSHNGTYKRQGKVMRRAAKQCEGVPRPVESAPKITPQDALETCDALGFERGTEGHSECALEVLTSG